MALIAAIRRVHARPAIGHAGRVPRGAGGYSPPRRTPSAVRLNIQVALDTATPLFRETLHRYAVHGRWAPDYPLMGWGEGTISARLGMTRSNMTIASPSHPEYRKLLVDQFVERAGDGGEGFQFDKAGMTGGLDFNPDVADLAR